MALGRADCEIEIFLEYLNKKITLHNAVVISRVSDIVKD